MGGILHIEPAERRGAHLLMTLYGASGGGKTYSALKVGYGLARRLLAEKRGTGKVLLVDTENERGRIYANVAPHQYASFTEPWTPERYIEALDQIEDEEFDVAIIDSGSHEWDDVGGILDAAEQTGATGLLKWLQPKLRHKKFVKKLLRTRAHLIICLRAKEKIIEGPVVNGKKTLVNAGWFPIQAKDFIYDMTVQLRLYGKSAKDGGFYDIEKCPDELLGAFDEQTQLSEETGERIAEWVLGAEPVDEKFEAAKRAGEDAAGKGMDALRAWFKQLPTKKMKDRVLPYVEGNLTSIAQAADTQREAIAKAAAEETRGDVGQKPLFQEDDSFPGDRPSSRPRYLDAEIEKLRNAATEEELERVEKEGSAALANNRASPEAHEEYRAAFRKRFNELLDAP